VPWINWLLLVSVLTLVFTFETSSALAFAFGMAVTGTITFTTLLLFYVVRHQWGKPLWLTALGAVPLLTVDLLFVAANLTKLRPRRVAAAADRAHHVHRAHHLVSRPRDRHPPARARRRAVAVVRR
jgi:K+ potassium transporter